jgi:hypothetical protein
LTVSKGGICSIPNGSPRTTGALTRLQSARLRSGCGLPRFSVDVMRANQPIIEFLSAFGEKNGQRCSDRTGLANSAEALDCSYSWHGQFGPFVREPQFDPFSAHARGSSRDRAGILRDQSPAWPYEGELDVADRQRLRPTGMTQSYVVSGPGGDLYGCAHP